MIMNFLKKVPAGMMIVPLLIGAVLNTFFPQALQLGSLTTATFSNAGAATAMGIQLVCLGTTLQLGDIGRVLKRGGILLLSKFCIGSVIGIAVGKIFGPAGVLGLSALAIISAVTNSNGSVYLALMQTYGDDVDGGAMALLALNDGPFMTMIAMGVSGLANIPIQALIATVTPILVGMILGNMDKKFAEFVSPAGSVMIPFVGLTLGAGINLMNVLKGGIPDHARYTWRDLRSYLCICGRCVYRILRQDDWQASRICGLGSCHNRRQCRGCPGRGGHGGPGP